MDEFGLYDRGRKYQISKKQMPNKFQYSIIEIPNSSI
jgi:hypothetical protein